MNISLSADESTVTTPIAAWNDHVFHRQYAFTAIKKLHQSTDVILREIRLLESMSVVIPEPSMVIRAVEIQISSRISFWDASIVTAAENAQCQAILSGNLNPGQYYAGIPVINPLLESFTLKGSK